MKFEVFNTHMELSPYKKDDYPVIERMYTAVDKFTQNEFPCGYTINEGVLYLPRGTSIGKIEQITGDPAIYNKNDDPFESMSRKHYSFYDLRDKLQEDTVTFLTENSNKQLAVNLATGFGKEEPYSRKIPTPTDNGWTRMGDLKVGDYVFDRTGKPTRILQIFEQGKKDIYKITFADGRYALCGLDHLWVTRGYKQGKYKTTSTRELLSEFNKKYSLYKESNDDTRDFFFQKYIPVCEPVQYPHKDVPMDPWVLGVFIGNGCLRESGLSISCGTEEIPDKIAKKYNLIHRRSSSFNYTYNFYDKFTGKRIKTKEFFKYVPELINTYSHEKFIPKIYLYNDNEIRMELLRGLMDTDGSISEYENRYHTMYSSCSKMLLEQMQQILFSLGLRSNISIDKRTEKYRDSYHGTLIFNIPNEIKHQFFTVEYKSHIAQKAYNIKQRDLYNDIRIKDIKLIKKELARCIMVDNPEHLYLTQDYIVTHNTMCTAYAITKLNHRALIITPNEGLKQQWSKTFLKMFDYKKDELMNISGSGVMEDIMNDVHDPVDVYFVNHQTLQSYLSNHSPYMLHQFFKKLNVGVRVYDESHLQFANILFMDFFSNTNRTWYLTATFDRSDKTESVCFKQAFNSVETFGEMESFNEQRKHVIYHIVNIRSRIDNKQLRKVIGYQGFTSASYGKYAFFADKNQTAYNSIKMLIDKIKDVEGKLLIFVPLIDVIEDLVKKLKDEFPDKTIGPYHSKISKSEKEDNLKKDIIISTIASCGTGVDIKRLRAIICAEPFASKVTAQQVIGRLREYDKEKDTYYFDLVDVSIPPNNWWHRGRYKKIETLVKSTIYLNLDE